MNIFLIFRKRFFFFPQHDYLFSKEKNPTPPNGWKIIKKIAIIK